MSVKSLLLKRLNKNPSIFFEGHPEELTLRGDFRQSFLSICQSLYHDLSLSSDYVDFLTECTSYFEPWAKNYIESSAARFW